MFCSNHGSAISANVGGQGVNMERLIPTESEVKNHFSKAKEIRCLNLDISVNIAYVNKFKYSEKDNAYFASGNIVTVWKDGTYAEITKEKS